jgi:hypothetical protein
MCGFAKVSLAIGVSLLLTGASSVQPPQGSRGGFFGGGRAGPMLLRNKSVQQELKLSEEQAKKINEVIQEVFGKHQDEIATLREQGAEQGFEKMQELMKKVSEETRKALAGVLQPDQEKRFKQIELQLQGARAFQEADVQNALKLTDEQKEKLKTIDQDAAKEMQNLRSQGGPGNFQEGLRKVNALRKEATEKAQSVLTEDQKKTWADMTGKTFEMKFEPRQRPERQ